MIAFQDVHFAFGGRSILSGASFEVFEGARAGLLGPNGSGKTTLLRILVGELAPDSGQVRLPRGKRLAYLAQHPEFPQGARVFRHVAEPPAYLGELFDRKRALEARMELEADPQRLDRMVERHRELEAEIVERGGFEVEGRAEEVLTGLGLPRRHFDREVFSLSGGEKNRVALARILCQSPDVLVLDEPTNYLDIEMVEWLEDFLASLSRTMIISSHDRRFLNRTATVCLDLRDGKVHPYRGDYDAYAEQREAEVELELKRYRQEQGEIARELEFIRRNFYGQKARQAKSREKRVARIERDSVAPSAAAAEGPRIRFGETRRGGEDVLRLEGVECGYGSKSVLRGVELELSRGERVALLGPNGCGKTTLLKTLAGDLPPLAGEVHRGARTVPGRYDQECAAIVSPRTLFDEVHDLVPRWEDQRVRDLLAGFLFRGDRILTPVGSLSGGEKSKLALIRLILSGANLLLLDEPTNHLDIHSRAALEEGLEGFPETMVFISHDRYFIERMADRILYIEGGELKELIGSYPGYREILRERRRRQAAERNRARQSERDRARAAARPPARTPSRTSEEQLLAEISSLEARLRERHEEASRPEVLRSGADSRRVKREIDELEARIAALYTEWESISRGQG